MSDERKIVERKKAGECKGAVEEFEERVEEGYCVLMMGRDGIERGEAVAFPQCLTTHSDHDTIAQMSLLEMGRGPRSGILCIQN